MTPEHLLSQDIASCSIAKVVRASGVNLIRQDNIWKGQCPFHDDSEQSLIIHPEEDKWECPECQNGGSAVDWVMKAEGVSKQHAQELLRSGQPLTPIVNGAVVKHSSVRRLDAPFDVKDDDQQILQHVINYYHETLKQSPAAMAYLKERGLDNSEIIEHFKLGFSDRTLGYRLPAKNRKEGAALRGRLQRLGIIKASGHELLRGSIVIPVIENGVIKQIYGRKVTQRLRPGTPLHCYLPIPQQGFINVKAIHTCEELIVCPSLIDALTFWCAGYKNVTCTYGAAVLTEEDLQTLTQGSVRRVLIAYAGTNEADAAANSLAEQLQGQNLECYRIEFPQGLDVNAYALANPPAVQSLGDVIRKAVWLGQGQPVGQSENPKYTPRQTMLQWNVIPKPRNLLSLMLSQSRYLRFYLPPSCHHRLVTSRLRLRTMRLSCAWMTVVIGYGVLKRTSALTS